MVARATTGRTGDVQEMPLGGRSVQRWADEDMARISLARQSVMGALRTRLTVLTLSPRGLCNSQWVTDDRVPPKVAASQIEKGRL